jgi:hypothetical protein
VPKNVRQNAASRSLGVAFPRGIFLAVFAGIRDNTIPHLRAGLVIGSVTRLPRSVRTLPTYQIESIPALVVH